MTPRPQPNPQEVRARFKGTVDGVAWWLNMWADTKLQPAIKASVEETAKAQVGLMKWTGHGVLLRLEVVRRHDKETPLEAVGILGESAFVIGSGQTPEDAWIEFQSRAGIWRPGVPEGWQLDQVMSTYTWVERDKNGELTYRNVPQGIVTDLESKIIYNWGQYYTSHLNTKRNNRRLWLTVAENAKASINDRVAKDSIDRSFRLVDESRKRVADIEERLQKALQAEKDGANAARIIRTLKGILTVAELVDKAALLMGESPDKFSGVGNAEGVIQRVDKINNGRREVSVELRASFDDSSQDLQKGLNQLWQSVQPAKPPETIEDQFKIIKP